MDYYWMRARYGNKTTTENRQRRVGGGEEIKRWPRNVDISGLTGEPILLQDRDWSSYRRVNEAGGGQ